MGESEMRIISIINEKGGVGKTATATNLSRALVLKNRRVLLIDLDKGGFAGSSLGIEEEKQTAYGIFTGAIDFTQVPIRKFGIDIIPGCDRISSLNVKSELKRDQYFILTHFLDSLPREYDFIILDCGGDRLAYMNALVASTDVLITVQTENSAAEGLSKAISTIKEVWEYITDKPRLLGILLTMYDERLNIHNLTASQIRNGELKESVFKTVIRRNVNIADAMMMKMPVCDFQVKSTGSLDYESLVMEILEKCARS